MLDWRKWLYGVISAAIGAIGTAVPVCIVDPATFNFSNAGLTKLGEVCAASALIAVANYLKQSPLPAESTVTTATATVSETTTTQPK
jgi:hypothetical protein